MIDDEWSVCANKLFYVAASPQFYEQIFRRLASSELAKPCGSQEGWTSLEVSRPDAAVVAPERRGEPLMGWTRVLVEKPFGKNLKTAEALERLLSGLFQEVQIYRIDHYLAKEMLQNILAFRFSNSLFE